jgi:acyl-CoA reductase-like NAD-dependent aldehyde dehydrogenase
MTSVDNIKLNLINGRWCEGAMLAPNRNPSDRTDLIGEYAQGTAEDVGKAVEAALQAAPAWWDSGIQFRADLLERVATQIMARREALGHLLAREEGKTLHEAIAEVTRAAHVFRFFSGEAVRVSGDFIESVRTGVDVQTRREPVGVVGLITPWNFPIAIPAWKIAPALAYGNTVVIKPPELTPACAHALAGILAECGCPDGVFNLVMGRGRIVGQALVDHPGVSALSFTGSVDVGRGIIARAAARQLKVQAEMGGKNATVVLADADLDAAIPTIVSSAYGSTGQRCTATSRVIVDRSILAEFGQRFVQAAMGIRVGHALDGATQMGPVVSEGQLAGNLKYIRMAREEGAEVIGGEVHELKTQGFFQRPAVFLNATNQMTVSREEIFGPCVSIIGADGLEHAIALANDSPFGLSAGICTANLKAAREFVRRSRSGLVMVNVPTAGVDYHVPFGGTKGSSYGPREQGRQAIEFYTSFKTAYMSA